MFRRFSAIFLKLGLCFCVLLLNGGCGSDASAPPQKASVVSQKIVADQSAQPQTSPKSVASISPQSRDAVPSAGVAPNAAEKGETGDQVSDADNMLPDVEDIYNPAGKINPFEPLFKEQPSVAEAKPKKPRKKRVPVTPLEKVDLSQLKLVGIIRADSGNRGLVQEASGKGYIVKIGTYMGINEGKIVTIGKDHLVVEEEVEDIKGDIVVRNRELKLQKPPGE